MLANVFVNHQTISIVPALATIPLFLLVSGDRYHPDPPPPRDHVLTGHVHPIPSPAEYTAKFWYEEARAAIEKKIKTPGFRAHTSKARNLVLFLGDGMSIPTLAAARTLLGQRLNQTGEEARLSFETFPTVGLAKTYCVNAQIPDSACTASAYLCGVKVNYGTIGVTAAVSRKDCVASRNNLTNLESIAAWALADGRDAGIVTTARITHASPAGTFAVVVDRNWENDARVRDDGHDPNDCPDIAQQLVTSYPGNQFKVILGGGRREFRPITAVDEEGTRGHRTDNRDLIQEWKIDKMSRNVRHQYVWNREQLLQVNTSLPEYLLGLFEADHLQYNLQANRNTEPSLTELTDVAIHSLRRNVKGFFLFIESGRIDHAHHENKARLALDETIELSKAVERAIQLLNEEDSLIVVTSDHAHVMSFNGYTIRGGNILGVSDRNDQHGRPYMTLSYTNGPGFRPQVEGARSDVTAEQNFDNVEWMSHVDIPLMSETHGGDDVAVFARGPHHALFTGLFEQSGVPHRLAYAACFGPGLHSCSSIATTYTLAPTFVLLLAIPTFFPIIRTLVLVLYD